MTRITTGLAGVGLAVSLLALPLAAGAEVSDVQMGRYSHHRFFFSEEAVWWTQDEASANYAMLEVSDLERVAGRTDLDLEAIRFLEDNLWERDYSARFEGEANGLTDLERIAGRQYLDTETIQFLEENFWDYEVR